MRTRHPYDLTHVTGAVVALRCLGFLLGLGVLLAGSPAQAGMPSARDGYGPDGSYRVQVELSPYLWLPASRTNFTLGPHGGVSGTVDTGIPTAQQLANSLHGAFMGYGLLRYGPWSAELDIDWVSASGHKTETATALGRSVALSDSASVVRVAPGFGYQVFSGTIGPTPVTVDARAGFAFFTWSTSVSGDSDVIGTIDDSGSFVQPWVGARMSFYPGQRWRIELAGLVQGFGVGGDSWGWGASAMVSYAVNDWMTVSGGFRALSSSRSEETTRARLPATRSIDMTAYGPVLGIGIRF